MKISVLTLFPSYFDALLNHSVIARAKDKGLFEFETVNFRDYTLSKHGHVDDTPYGGGSGMILACQPILDALKATRKENSHVVLLSPQGKTFTQSDAKRLAAMDHVIFLCGHYEGFDERIRAFADEQLSLGDFVLTGGEPAATVMCDAILRLQKGTIKEDCWSDDSFENSLLEYPQYTKPAEYEGMKVPEVLLSGHHVNIEKFRRRKSLENTLKHRPDLLETADLSKEDEKVLEELKEDLENRQCPEGVSPEADVD